jgi:hypothetical protein
MSKDKDIELEEISLDLPMTCKGVNGTVIFDGSFVTIDRTKGFFARATVGKGTKKIALAQITSVRWKKPGAGVRGYISFSLPGGVETRSRFGNQSVDAAKDENAVLVAKSQTPEFLALKQVIEDALASHHSQNGPQAAPAESGPADRLKELAELHESGLLTDEEFAEKRAALIEKL